MSSSYNVSIFLLGSFSGILIPLNPRQQIQMTPGRAHEGPPGSKYPQGSQVRGSDHAPVYQPGDVWDNGAPPSSGSSFPAIYYSSGSSFSPVPSVSSADTVIAHAERGWQGLNPAAPPYYGSHQAAPYGMPNTGLSTAFNTPRGSQQATPYNLPEKVYTTPRGGQNFTTRTPPASRNGDPNVQDFSPDTTRHSGQLHENLDSKYELLVKIANEHKRRTSVANQLTRVGTNEHKRRASLANQLTPIGYWSPQADKRHEFMVSQESSSAPARLVHPALTTNNNRGQSMYAITEKLAVQEFAFRRGQQDRGNTRDRVPANPFHHSFSTTWTKHYDKGKRSWGEAVSVAANLPPSSRANYNWPPLINPYTQSQENPKGIYDEAYARKACVAALDSMEAMVKNVYKRVKSWEKMICDVPMPVADALLDYPDLLQRYELLQRAAEEARGGGLRYTPYTGH